SRVIIAVDCTESFTIKDSIEQGESISLLVGRIFYNHFLECIQSDTSLGYKMVVEKPYNLKKGFTTIHEQRQNIVAFADDTIWIASSKEQMERTIQI
ncbi:46287_t:CDS:1, partial [Gigaspora margarita]